MSIIRQQIRNPYVLFRASAKGPYANRVGGSIYARAFSRRGLGVSNSDYAIRLQGSYDAMRIRDAAGFKARPGYDPDVTPGVTGARWSETSALSITQESDISGYSPTAPGTLSGTGAKDDPYVVSNVEWNGLTAANQISWNDPDADYFIKFVNCYFRNPGSASYANARINISSRAGDDSKCIFDQCTFSNTGAAESFLINESGIVEVLNCNLERTNHNKMIHTVGGVKSKTTVEDCLIDTPLSGGGAILSADILDGFITEIRRVQINGDYKYLIGGSQNKAQGTYVIEQLLAEDKLTGMIFLDGNDEDINYLEMRDCNWTMDAASGTQYIIRCEASGYHTIRSGVIENCSFEHASTTNLARMITIGSNSPGDGVPNGIIIKGCYFKKDITQTAPGNEVLEFFNAENCVIEDCWVDGCGEDAYEFHTCGGGNHVINCGGNDVGGQMVDYYKTKNNEPHGTNLVMGVYGDCGHNNDTLGQAVALLDVTDMVVQGVYVDNSVATNTAGLININEDGSPVVPDRIRVYGSLSADQYCANGNQLDVTGAVGSDIVGIWYENGVEQSYTSGTPVDDVRIDII